MVANENEAVGIAQWTETSRESDLRGLVYNAVIEATPSKDRMVYAESRRCDYLWSK